MDTKPALPTRPRTAATPAGAAPVTAEVRVPASTRDGDEIVLQRLEGLTGPLLRLGYRRADRMIRGPVSLAPADLTALRGRAFVEPLIEEVLRL